MSDYLFVTWDGGGNLTPAIRIAVELRRRGHRVRFRGHASQQEAVTTAGLDFRTYPTAKSFSALEPLSPIAMLATLADRRMAEDILAELEADPADVVVVDCFLVAAMRALRRSGREYAVLVHCLESSMRKMARGPLGLVLRARGFRTIELVEAARPAFVTAHPDLELDDAVLTHVGPVVTGLPAAPVEPTVLISLSTVRFKHLHTTWQRVLDAVGGLPARVVATTGPAVDIDSLRIPASVELHHYLPHEEILPLASLAVSHGGNGTTMAALAHGVPVLILPVDSDTDQPFVGKQIERAGAGRSIKRTAPPVTIRAAIEELLADGPHRAQAAHLGHRIRELDGQNRAADLLESLVRPDAHT